MTQEKTEHEKVTEIITDYVKDCIKKLEAGQSVLVRGGYQWHTYKESIIDKHCHTIVQKLYGLGYRYTTNHGHGCYDYTFLKPINIEV